MENLVLNDLEYLKSIHPKEKLYRKISLIIAMFFWIGTFGILLSYAFFFGIFIIFGHAIFLSYIKGYGIKITAKQFPEIYKLAEITAKKLGMPSVPAIYLYNMDGMFNAFATHFFSRNFIIITTSILEACKDDKKKIEFIIAHEMTHLQRGHTREQFLLFPSRFVPWLSNAYSRACEYSCDGVAAKYVLESEKDAIEGVLLLPTADRDRAKMVNLDAYEEQRSESGSFWMTLTETRSTHPFSFHRVANIRSLFDRDIAPIKKSLWGILFAPIFSIQAVFFVYFAFLIGMMMAGFLSEKNNDDFEDYPTNLEYSSDDTEYYTDEDYYTDEYDTGEYLDTNSGTNESGSGNMTITE